MLRITLLNGPNLNLLGTREQDIYGSRSFEDFLEELNLRFPGIQLSYFQSNIEGDLINLLHQCRATADAIVLNAGGYTHTSIALADAVAAIGLPVLEVHISNVLAREDFRKTSFIAAKCVGSISGLGLEGYALALQYFQDRLAQKT
ncbi:MAG: type II 3-dehydroquinate dehydratase [Bacteroidetes bacterium]|nr:type II 3-dehydroquinate dehydratase [Bacteroidota bacterium]MBS1628962.1 type II 3-dehydroquinate dehydratase [Bacteroidota bacterium]